VPEALEEAEGRVEILLKKPRARFAAERSNPERDFRNRDAPPQPSARYAAKCVPLLAM